MILINGIGEVIYYIEFSKYIRLITGTPTDVYYTSGCITTSIHLVVLGRCDPKLV